MFIPPLKIGVGRFDQTINIIEDIDFKWWAILFSFIFWVIPMGIVYAYNKAADSIIKFDQLKDSLLNVLRDKEVPIKVNIDHEIPISFDQSIHVPVKLDTEIDIHENIEIFADIPIKMELPVDTIFETNILGMGKVKIPVKSIVPVDIILPFKDTVHMKIKNLPIKINEEALVKLPPVNVPIECQIETKIDLMSNWKEIEKYIKIKSGK